MVTLTHNNIIVIICTSYLDGQIKLFWVDKTENGDNLNFYASYRTTLHNFYASNHYCLSIVLNVQLYGDRSIINVSHSYAPDGDMSHYRQRLPRELTLDPARDPESDPAREIVSL